jgi:hypothetical protein
MRNLTIKRTKSFVGCLAKMKIYIEDFTSNEMFINNTPCRKIGDLKNGEEKTFQIGEQEAKVFVIADQLSKNYCNEYYQLPEGEWDIALTGRNKFNPAGGNAFRFDNNDSAEVKANRKKGTTIGLMVPIAAVVVGLVVGNLIGKGVTIKMVEPKDFSYDKMSITLTEEFEKTDMEGFTVAYGSKDVAVFAIKESFSLQEDVGSLTLKEYANIVIEKNNRDATVKEKDGLTCFEFDYLNPETKEAYRYFAYVYKSEDAFWLVQFAVLKENSDTYEEKIGEWAKSVEFSK